ncbi:MAG: hypothetical protein WC529_03640 [Candidatus Margulisiibacteriota bacterium]
MVKVQENRGFAIRPRPVRTLTDTTRRLADRVGKWLFPNPEALLGWQPAALGPRDISPVMFMDGMSASGGKLVDELDVSRQTLIDSLAKNGHKDTASVEAAFSALARLAPAQRERNLRVAFQLVEWQVSPGVVAASLLLDSAELPGKIDAETKKALANINRLNALACNCSDKQQISHFRNLLFQLADSHETLLALAAKDLCDLRLYNAGIKQPKKERIERAFHTSSWVLKYLNLEECGELEDLALLHLDPAYYKKVEELQAQTIGMGRTQALERLKGITQDLDALLDLHEIPHRIIYRVKRVPSFGRKVNEKGEIPADSNGIRVILTSNNAADCYLTLFRIREQLSEDGWEEIPAKYDDYIAKPRPTSYQALHAQFRHADGYTLEAQFRTEEMDWNAEFGKASHAAYKTGDELAKIVIDNRANIAEQRFAAKRETMQKAGVYYVYDVDNRLFKLISVTPDAAPTLLDFAFARGLGEGLLLQSGLINGQHAALRDPVATGDVVRLLKGTHLLSAGRDKDVNTFLGRAVIHALSRGGIDPRQLADERRLITKGGSRFAELSRGIAGEIIAEVRKYFDGLEKESEPETFRFSRAAEPQLRFSLERLARRKGFSSVDELYLVMGLLNNDDAAFAAALKTKVRENAVIAATETAGRTAKLAMLGLNIPGVALELFRLMEKYGIKVLAMEQKPLRGNVFGQLKFALAFGAREKYQAFIADLENLYRDVPPPAPQLGKIVNIDFRIKQEAVRLETLKTALGEIVELGANVSKIAYPSASPDKESTYTLSIQLPYGNRGPKIIKLLSERLYEIEGIRGVVVTS